MREQLYLSGMYLFNLEHLRTLTIQMKDNPSFRNEILAKYRDGVLTRWNPSKFGMKYKHKNASDSELYKYLIQTITGKDYDVDSCLFCDIGEIVKGVINNNQNFTIGDQSENEKKIKPEYDFSLKEGLLFIDLESCGITYPENEHIPLKIDVRVLKCQNDYVTFWARSADRIQKVKTVNWGEYKKNDIVEIDWNIPFKKNELFYLYANGVKIATIFFNVYVYTEFNFLAKALSPCTDVSKLQGKEEEFVKFMEKIYEELTYSPLAEILREKGEAGLKKRAVPLSLSLGFCKKGRFFYDRWDDPNIFTRHFEADLSFPLSFDMIDITELTDRDNSEIYEYHSLDIGGPEIQISLDKNGNGRIGTVSIIKIVIK